jgi:hypothetical protein
VAERRETWTSRSCNLSKKLSTGAVRKVLSRALFAQGLRDILPEGVNRHEVKEAHGYRKFFKTRAEQEMRPLNVELDGP